LLLTFSVAPTNSDCLPLLSSTPAGDGELVKLSTTMLFEEPSLNVIDTGNVIEKLAFASPLTSKVAGLPEPLELIVAPPVVVRLPLVDKMTDPATELEEISPNNRPFRTLMFMVLIIFALTVAEEVAAPAGSQDRVAAMPTAIPSTALLMRGKFVRQMAVSILFTFIINKIDHIVGV